MPPKRKKAMKNHVARKKTAKTMTIKQSNNMVKKEENEDVENPYNDDLMKARYPRDVKKLKKIKTGLTRASQKMQTIKCSECIKRFRFKKSLQEHKLNEHSKVPGSVQCNRCSVCCPDLPTMKKHIADVHERMMFKCPNCDSEFVRHAHVLRHMAQKGCSTDGVAPVYPCEICNAKFRRKDNLMVHLRLQHIVAKDYMCKQCPYSTRSFSKHIIHHLRFHTEGKGQRFECDHCGKVTGSRAAICKHLEIHGEKKFACDVCGYSTFTMEVMRRHVFTHLLTKPYQCERCDMSFIQRVQLQKHMLKHSNALQCKICDKTFTSNNQLLKHAIKHEKAAGNLSCPMENCKIKFHSEKQLKTHIQSHIGDKVFACEVCCKKFLYENDMRRHVTSHLLQRPRRCMYCVSPRAYVRGEQLVRHVRKIHPDVFRDHLAHVRSVLGHSTKMERVKKSEIESILLMLDAEADRILQGYGEGVLYGGMMETDLFTNNSKANTAETSPVMSEKELETNLKKLLVQLIDKELLECFGWPNANVDTVLEKVIQNCGAKPADRDKWTRVQCLRENTKHLFLHVIEDKNIARMLDSHTIDQIVKHILTQVSDDASETDDETNDNETKTYEIEAEAYEIEAPQEISVEFESNEIPNGSESVIEEIYIDGCKVTEISVENEFGSIEETEDMLENGNELANDEEVANIQINEEKVEQNCDVSTEDEIKIMTL